MLPCENLVKYKIPILKAKLAKELKAKGYKNKEIAKALDVTEAAVSQYLSGKRAKKEIEQFESKKIASICKFCKFCKN
jgi:predicted transcriptional regulator